MKASQSRRSTWVWVLIMSLIVIGIIGYGHHFLPINFFEGLIALMCAMAAAVWSGKIDLPGALVGGVIGIGIFLGGGFAGLALLLVFFGLGSVVSHWGKEKKAKLGLAQENEGKRSVRHAISNGGIAAICGLLAWGIPEQEMIFLTALTASFASATADTFSSELGNLLGRKYVDVLTFKPGKRGEDGVISLEGTLVGASGSLLIALLYGISQGWHATVFVIFLAGIIGNHTDSILGATLQRRGFLSNDEVNLLNTLFAAFIGGLFAAYA